jgi:ketosteroid isomerase-like protein
LRELNDGYMRSVALSDVAWFDAHLAEDFLNGNPDGTLSDRAGFLEEIARPCPLAELRAEDVRIRLRGDVAIIHARTAYRTADGQPGAGRYTDIWARREGRWLCVSAEVRRG